MFTLLVLNTNLPLQSNRLSVKFLTEVDAIDYAMFLNREWEKVYSIIPHRELTSKERIELKQKGIVH